MKRTIALIALMLFTCTSVAFATNITSGGEYKATAPNAAKLGKLSTKVDAEIVTAQNTYAAITKHLNGTKAFGSSAGDTRIYYKAGNDGETTQASGIKITGSDSSVFQSGWTSL